MNTHMYAFMYCIFRAKQLHVLFFKRDTERMNIFPCTSRSFCTLFSQRLNARCNPPLPCLCQDACTALPFTHKLNKANRFYNESFQKPYIVKRKPLEHYREEKASTMRKYFIFLLLTYFQFFVCIFEKRKIGIYSNCFVFAASWWAQKKRRQKDDDDIHRQLRDTKQPHSCACMSLEKFQKIFDELQFESAKVPHKKIRQN